MKKIKILVADDHTLVRDGLVSMLKMDPDIQITGEASDGKEAIEKLKSIEADIVIMDIMMKELNGLEATKIIKETHENVEVILLSMEVNQEFIAEGIKNGAMAYLPKDISKTKLIEAIKCVYSGEKYFSEQISKIIFENFYNKSVSHKIKTCKAGEKLSKRETEILILLSQGKTSHEISEELFISVKTIDTHRYNLMQKLELKNTAELVKYAIKHGYIEI